MSVLLLLLGGRAAAPVPPRPTYFVRDLLAFVQTTLGITVYPGHIPEGVSLPAVSLTLVGTARETVLRGSAGIAEAHVDLTVSSPDPADTFGISETLRIALHGYRGTMGSTRVRPALLVDQVYQYEDPPDGSDDGTHSQVNLYYVYYQESIPAFAG